MARQIPQHSSGVSGPCRGQTLSMLQKFERDSAGACCFTSPTPDADLEGFRVGLSGFGRWIFQQIIQEHQSPPWGMHFIAGDGPSGAMGQTKAAAHAAAKQICQGLLSLEVIFHGPGPLIQARENKARPRVNHREGFPDQKVFSKPTRGGWVTLDQARARMLGSHF